MLRSLQVIGTLSVILAFGSAPIFAQTPATGGAPSSGTTAAPAHHHKRLCRKFGKHGKKCNKAAAPATTAPAATPAK